VRHVADRIAVMYLGRIVETGPAETVFADPRHPYTRALLSAIPLADPGARRERLAVQGEIPSPLDPPSGCHFRTRCPYAADLCRDQRPPLEDDGVSRATACHFWRTLPPLDVLPNEAEPDPRLERLFAAFRDGAPPAPAMTA
jgi:peptide/nickel transport system ATP-binding protein/oligopeptide transport system ATP-binding protein